MEKVELSEVNMWKFTLGTLTLLVASITASLEIGNNTAPLIWGMWGSALIISDSIDEINKRR